MRKITMSVLLTVILSGCVNHQPLRNDLKFQDQCLKNNSKECKDNTIYELNNDQSIKIAILEINDFGIILNKKTSEKILEDLRVNMNSENKPIVNLYIHGWNHSGKNDDSDLLHFERATRALYKSQDFNSKNEKNINKEKRNVIGIYVSWRGQTLPTKALNTAVTFWGRKASSEEVGRGELTSFILRLEDILKPSNHDDKKEDGTLILAGHSFGASALYNAIQYELISRFYESLAEQKRNPEKDIKIKGFGDIVILVNPAIQALRFTPLREAVYKEGSINKNIFNNNLHPNLVVLAAENDFPVKTLFPLGRNLAELKNYHGKTLIYNGISGAQENVSLRQLDTIAIGQYEPYFTHWGLLASDINKDENEDINVKYCLGDMQQVNWLSRIMNQYPNSEDFYTVDKETGKNFTKVKITNNMNLVSQSIRNNWKELQKNKSNVSWKRNPYWFIRVKKNLINGHNGIWNEEMSCLVLLLLTTDRDQAGTKTIFKPIQSH